MDRPHYTCPVEGCDFELSGGGDDPSFAKQMDEHVQSHLDPGARILLLQALLASAQERAGIERSLRQNAEHRLREAERRVGDLNARLTRIGARFDKFLE